MIINQPNIYIRQHAFGQNLHRFSLRYRGALLSFPRAKVQVRLISVQAYGACEGMTLFPAEKTFRKWLRLVPTDGDLVFFKGYRQTIPFLDLGVPLPLYTVHEAKCQSAELLGLNQKSWYGYIWEDPRFA